MSGEKEITLRADISSGDVLSLGGTLGTSSYAKESKDVNLLRKDIQELRVYVEKQKSQTIETLAIFVSLFTFISVEIQILNTDITFLSIIGFTLITLGGLLVFISVLDQVMGGYMKKPAMIAGTLILFAGVFFAQTNSSKAILQLETLVSKDQANRVEIEKIKNCLIKRQRPELCFK